MSRQTAAEFIEQQTPPSQPKLIITRIIKLKPENASHLIPSLLTMSKSQSNYATVNIKIEIMTNPRHNRN